MNVRKVGAVKHGRNTLKRSASEHGSVALGSIDGSLSPEWYRNRRCFPLHHPRRSTMAVTGVSLPSRTGSRSRQNCETRGVRVTRCALPPRQPLSQCMHELLGFLGQLLRLLSGLRLLRCLLAQLLRPLHRLGTDLLRLLRRLGTGLLRLLDSLGTGLLRSGSGATAYLPSLVLGAARGRGLSAQRVDRVVDDAARLLVQGNGHTIPGPRSPPVPSTAEPQHQQQECQGPHRLAPVRLRHLRRLLGSPHADLLRPLDGLSTNLLRPVLVSVFGVKVALRRIHTVATVAGTAVDLNRRCQGIAEGITG